MKRHTLKLIKYFKYLVHLFFILVLLELFIMGSGRFLEIGPLTIRMIFYILVVSASVIIYMYIHKIKIHSLLYLFAFLSMILFSTLVGLYNGADTSYIFEDVKPLLYFLMILPLSLFLTNLKSILLISNLIKFSAVLMAMLYLTLVILIYIGYLDFGYIWKLFSSGPKEFFFRAQTGVFFYKGFLYLCIGFIFFTFSSGKLNKFFMLLTLIAIILTFTRGFLLALILAFIFINLIDIKKRTSFIFLLSITVILSILVPLFIIDIAYNPASDIIRIIQFNQVLDNLGFISFFIGHGFGIGVPIRPVHMEISYLEIFHKQGMIGLVFWFSILYSITINYINIKDKNHLVKSLFVGALFVFMQSLTNPFMNNPIGMGMILISLISLELIRKKEYREKGITWNNY